MDKTKKNQEQPKMNQHHLKNTRYNGSVVPKKERGKPAAECRLPDKDNPERIKNLH